MTTGRPRGRSPRKNHSQRKTSAARRIVAPFEFRGHTLDEFQVQAIIALQQQMTTLVSAPTGTGKSLIADFLVDDSLKQDRRVVYTAPIKALVNQKYRDFRAAYGAQRTGIMTGDVTENPGAPLVVMTTEVLRNMLLRGGQPLVPPKVAAEAAEPGNTIADSTPADSAYDTVRPPLRADWIVFDEIHYINHPERGTVWEEAIMLLPPSLRLLGLSATVPNIDELAAWLENVKGEPVTAIVHDERAVPLRHYYFTHDGRTLTHRQAWEHFTGGDLKGDTLDNDVLGTAGLTGGKARRRRHRRAESDPSRHLDIISYVSRERLFPCIYFAFSRRACEQMARDLARRRNFLRPHESEAVHAAVRQMLHDAGLHARDVPGLAAMQEMWYRGIGVHHAGLLPVVKHIVERLLERRILRVVYATETFAVGVNMPVRTVCFDDVIKFDGKHHRPLTQQEFLQMAGRAGRRGMDAEGTVLIRADADSMAETGWRDWEQATLEPIASRLALSYTTVLNLVERFSAAAGCRTSAEDSESGHLLSPSVEQWLNRSLYVAQSERKDEAVARLSEQFAGKVGELRRLGYLHPQQPSLTVRGVFCRNVWIKELLMTELAFDGTLGEISPAELAGLTAAVVWESRPQDDALPPAAPQWLAAVHMNTDRIVRWAGPNIRPSLAVEGRIAPLVSRWAAAAGAEFHTGTSSRAKSALTSMTDAGDLAQLLRGYPLEPGDFVALCRQAVDLLRQIATAAEEAAAFIANNSVEESVSSSTASASFASILTRVRDNASAAVAAVDRDVVAASRSF